jgi:hypothetical protein
MYKYRIYSQLYSFFPMLPPDLSGEATDAAPRSNAKHPILFETQNNGSVAAAEQPLQGIEQPIKNLKNMTI